MAGAGRLGESGACDRRLIVAIGKKEAKKTRAGWNGEQTRELDPLQEGPMQPAKTTDSGYQCGYGENTFNAWERQRKPEDRRRTSTRGGWTLLPKRGGTGARVKSATLKLIEICTERSKGTGVLVTMDKKMEVKPCRVK